MALYALLRVGVIKTDTQQRIVPASGDLWREYQAWLRAGNVPDPYVPPPPPAETLAQAKQRRSHEIASDGLARMQTRLAALRTFDSVQLLREVILSVAPAARALTTKMQFCADTYVAGDTALAAVQAATTIAEVDAVQPAWPPL